MAEFGTSAQAVLMIILGGIGTLSGPVVGAFVIVYVENVLSIYVERWPTVMGLIFILMVLFARQGFVGGVTQAWAALTTRRTRKPPPHPAGAGVLGEGGGARGDDHA